MGEQARHGGGLPLRAFDPAPVGVAVTSGPDHELVYINDAFRTMLGDRTLGIPFFEAFDDLVQRGYVSHFDRVYRTGESLALSEAPFELSGQGYERYATCSWSRISLGDGVDGVLMMVTEVTDRVDSVRASELVGSSRTRFLRHYQSLLKVETRYRSLMAVETQVLVVADPVGDVVEPSPGLQRMTGQSWEEMRGEGWQDTVHPDDLGRVKDVIAEAARTATRFDVVMRLRMADGTYRHIRLVSQPVLSHGVLVEWVGVCSDVEQEWQEARQAELLEQAATATANVAHLDEVLTMLTHVIVPNVLDGCGIYLVPEFDGELPEPLVVQRFVSIVRRDLEPAPQPGTVVLTGGWSGFVEAVRTRRPVHRTFPAGRPPPGLAPPAAEEWFRRTGANSAALVPVIVDGSVAAVLDAVVCGDREPIGETDVELLNRLVDHAHAHLSNAMRFQRTQRVALAFQQYLLSDPPEIPGLEITARYRPSATVAEIGGDWYDCFRLPDGSAVLTIGDVAGHDLTAATTMSQLRNMLRGLAMDRDEPPGDILRRLDVATESLYDGVTATCVLARLERCRGVGWRLTYSVAGHPPPLLVTREGEARYLDSLGDPLLGVAGDQPRTTAVAHLPPESTLLLYTDGLVENPGEHLDEGLERLIRNASSLAREPLDVLCDQLLARLSMAAKDDIAMIALRPPGG
ncbi:SpoIIE family protein phosphatase [Nonomuraea phyllanthi]|uniref:SpoIIE family protein phosphatase n=1 Tax=Nonomuraea phyllanthi TaxID=2219224 RepID=UPI0012938BC6|nr:SpoIIE family protein phosphatase [Nonomuraea phyllanthi]QFY13378.1 SpoIIE family protein phosphatase [Nonomuraea phyllanthi]